MSDAFLENPILETPLADKRSEQPGTFGFESPRPTLPPIRNCASDENIIKQVREEIVPVVTFTRTTRTQLEEEWRAIQRMEMMLHDGGRKYYGRSDNYIPVFARNRQSYTSALSRGLFPSSEYMDVADRNDDEEKAAAVKSMLQWEFDRVARLRANIKPMLACLTAFGNAPLKILWKHATRREGRMGKSGNEPQFATIKYSGLRVIPRHPLSVYVYPTSANALDECTMLFEDSEITREQIIENGKKHGWQNIEDALHAPVPPNYTVNQTEILTNVYGFPTPVSSQVSGTKLGEMKVLTEVWTFLILPHDQYIDGEDTNDAVPVRIILAGNTPVWVGRNPFFHQQPPYRWARMNTYPGLFYGYGLGRVSRPFQYLTNDFANQSNDTGIYALNPIVKINPSQIVGGLRPLAPGVPWYMNSMDAVQFDRPPTDLMPLGLQAMNTWLQMGKDLGGTPDVMQGTGAGKGARTATGAQILQRNAMAPLQDIVEDLEYDICEPLMYMTWVMEQQFREDSIQIAVSGRKLEVAPSDLIIDPEMMWLAANQSANQQQRAQSAMQFAQMLMQQAPYLQQLGYVIDTTPALRKVWSDGMGFRNFDALVKQNPQAAAAIMRMQQAQQQQPQQSLPTPGDRVRSTLEQVTGTENAPDMVAGEGEDFQNVRDESDEISSMLGGMQ